MRYFGEYGLYPLKPLDYIINDIKNTNENDLIIKEILIFLCKKIAVLEKEIKQ